MTWIIRKMAVAFILAALIMSALVYSQQAQHTAPALPHLRGTPAWFMDHCEPTSSDEFPGKVIMVPQGRVNTVFTSNPRLISEALDQTFGQGTTTHKVIAFCSGVPPRVTP